MMVLAVETALAEADVLGHPQILLVLFWRIAIEHLRQVCGFSLERNFSEKVKAAVMYPVPIVLVPVAQVALFFFLADTRKKICVTGHNMVLMESVKLTSDQVLVTMRGRVAAVTEHTTIF